jgi:hypothetical protein
VSDGITFTFLGQLLIIWSHYAFAVVYPDPK